MIIGYRRDPETVVCVECYEELPQQEINKGWNAVIKYVEQDTPLHCNNCLVLLPVYLTDNGLEYILEQIDNYLVYDLGRADVLARWVEHYYEDLLNFDQTYTIGVLLSTVERFLKKRERKDINE